MASDKIRFDRFVLHLNDRQLRCDDVPLELSARYFDALALLVRQAGKLVSKDQFMAEVWKGVPVTDEALTQCVKMLRRRLGDHAGSPRFIETVPKHGYRFIAPVELIDENCGFPVAQSARKGLRSHSWQEFVQLGATGTMGGGIAGIVGGLLYGFAGTSQSHPGIGEASSLLVIFSVTLLMALIGGAGVAFGIAAAGAFGRHGGPWSIAGGAAGGMVVGSLVKLLGLDAFSLFFGQTPGNIAGGVEGALLGGAVGLGICVASRWPLGSSLGRRIAAGAISGGVAGIMIALLGGHLMVGSLDLLARQFGSRFGFDRIGALFGESGLGPVSQIVVGGLEGALFGGCIVAALLSAKYSVAPNEG